MRIPLRFDARDDGPSRFVVPVVFVAFGIGAMVWFRMEGFAVAGWRGYLPYAVGGLFVAMGVGSLVTTLRRDAGRKAAQRALEEHRDAPWLVRPEWRSDELVAAGGVDRGSLLFAVVWNLFAWPLSFVLIRAEQGSGDQAVWLVAIFPLVGLGMLARVAYQILRARKFGRTVVRLESMPLRLGGRLAGSLETTMGPEARPADGVLVKVSCYRQRVRYTRDSDGDRKRRIERDLLWRDESRRPVESSVDPRRVRVPFSFRLPADPPPSTPLKLDNRILWEISAEAEVPGIDLAAQVEVPVFPPEPGAPSADSSGEATPSRTVLPAHDVPAPVSSFDEPVTDGIVLVDEPERFELHFTAGRTRKGAIIIGGIGGVMLLAGVPLLAASPLIGLIFIAMSALMIYGGIQQATNDTVLRIESGRVRVTHDGVGMPADVDFPVDQVEEVSVRLGNSSSSKNATYSLALLCRVGEGLEHLEAQADKVMGFMSRFGVDESHPAMQAMREGAERPRVIVADGLSDKDEADWLAAKVEKALAREKQVSP